MGVGCIRHNMYQTVADWDGVKIWLVPSHIISFMFILVSDGGILTLLAVQLYKEKYCKQTVLDDCILMLVQR